MALPKLETPTHELVLPSTNKKIKFRPFLVKEQKILYMAQNSKSESEIINSVGKLVSNCTFGEIDPDTAPMFDIEYIFIKLRSKSVGEKIWELPLWPEFCKQVQSEIADVKNTGAPMQAGTIAGGAFLKEFVGEDIPWVHFDIAGTAWGVKPDSVNPKGSATGVGVRLVLDMFGV